MVRVAVITAIIASFWLVESLKIILNNDDGWATANIREFYKALKAEGHDTYIVAPVQQQSGQGGRTIFASEAALSAPGQYDSVPAGAPSFGSDPADSHIWYYNGTPAAVTFFALDYLVKEKQIFNGSEPDLIVTGPNEGTNTGAFVFTLSGTVGGAYAAVSRGIPAIAFSASDTIQREHKSVEKEDDPATILGKLAAKVVTQLESNFKRENNQERRHHDSSSAKAAKNGRLLPYGYGISVNFPYISTLVNQSESKHCIDPPFVHTRLTGGAMTNYAAFNNETQTFTWAMYFTSPGVNTCINGDCSLPGETDIIKECKSAVSVWTIDYDAPKCGGAVKVRGLLEGLVEDSNDTPGRGDRDNGDLEADEGETRTSEEQTSRAECFHIDFNLFLTMAVILIISYR